MLFLVNRVKLPPGISSFELILWGRWYRRPCHLYLAESVQASPTIVITVIIDAAEGSTGVLRARMISHKRHAHILDGRVTYTVIVSNGGTY